jgi:hypothetical protein
VGGASIQQPPRSERRRHGVAEALAAEALAAEASPIGGGARRGPSQLPMAVLVRICCLSLPGGGARRGHHGSPHGGARLVVLVPLT